jgi:hypothetical protein
MNVTVGGQESFDMEKMAYALTAAATKSTRENARTTLRENELNVDRRS